MGSDLAPCLNCNDRYPSRLRCTEEEPARDCTTPQLRPHTHVYCTKCMAEWFEPVGYDLERERLAELPPG
jgi:hypothetical protein